MAIYERKPWLKNYPEWVPENLEVTPSTTFGDFKASVSRRPDAPAVHYFDHTISYGEIDAASDSFSAALFRLGLQKGDRILVVLQNVPEFLITTYAAWKIGAIVVPLNPMYKAKELSYYFKDAQPKVFVTHEEIAASLNLSEIENFPPGKLITTSPLNMLGCQAEIPHLLKAISKTAAIF